MDFSKDDVSPRYFRLQDGSADEKIVAVYCIQDCALCINLIDKLKIITNNIGMARMFGAFILFISQRTRC